MYFSITDKSQKTLWTHSTLLKGESFAGIQKLEDGRSSFLNKFQFLATYVSLEAVNRISPLKALPLHFRAGAVVATLFASRYAAKYTYEKSIEVEKKSLLDGAPVWENKSEVPELDKKFFFIDDDNNYQPSLWHHGIYSIEKPKRFFHKED